MDKHGCEIFEDGSQEFEIQDCKDVDALWRPTLDSDLEIGHCYKPRTRTRKNFGHPCPFIFDQMCYEFQSFHGFSKFSRVEERFRAFLTVTVRAGSGLPKSSKIVITAKMSKIAQK